MQRELEEVSFVARITVLSVFFLFASLLCPHLWNKSAANGNRSAWWYDYVPFGELSDCMHPQHTCSAQLQPTTILSTTAQFVNRVHEGTGCSQTYHKFSVKRICLGKVSVCWMLVECGIVACVCV